jgi:hypothetical protein
MIKDIGIDVFWNAASFGEMEPEVVENYLSYVVGNAKWIYLLQARHGKETVGKTRVHRKTVFEDYVGYLSGYSLVDERDARKALGHMPGYFEGVWKRS